MRHEDKGVKPLKRDNSKIEIFKIDRYCQAESIDPAESKSGLILGLILILYRCHFGSFCHKLGKISKIVGQIVD